MKFRRTKYGILLSLVTVALASCTNRYYDDFVRKISFNDGWKFHYGDLPHFPDTTLPADQWQDVDLPHDWSVVLPFTKESPGGTATGYATGGTGWYMKTFTLSPDQSHKLISLYFEGSYMETEVWMNGRKVTYHPYGYTSFFCDITPYCSPAGTKNTLAVKVVNEGKNSRWYSGSGIYRNVWMQVTDKIHLDTWGIYITTPLVSKEKALVTISADLHNESESDIPAEILFRIYNANHKLVGDKMVSIKSASGTKETVTQQVVIQQPDLWSVENPAMYSLEIELQAADGVKDKTITPFGIRSISFSAEKGFLLNGRPVKLKGGCLHHDNGLLGAAAIDRAEERKVELLKANGFNAVRCAHNPPSEKFLDACDRLGLLVIDEAFDHWQKAKNPDDYHRFFDKWNETDFTSMVLRDRNHPSVIMWSIGNEIQERADTSGLRIEKNFRRLLNLYDPTRPMTLAVNDFWDNPHYTWKDSERTFDQLDVGGYNYLWWIYESDHLQFPDRIIFGSESTPQERAINWDLVEKHPYVIGDFVWTAMDYLGETGIGHTTYVKEWKKGPHQLMEWPWFNAWCGDIDICGSKKPQAALRDVMWGNSKIEMMVHCPVPPGMVEKVSYWGWLDELPSWNWRGHENETLEVRVFTRYPSVRLYLNGKLTDEKPTSKDTTSRYIAIFKVKYEPGKLEAIAVENNMEKDRIAFETSSPPYKIHLQADKSVLRNSRNDLSFVQIELIDKKGRLVQDDDRQVDISLTGAGEIAAAGNASPTDMKSFRSLHPVTFRGKALAIVKPKGNTGNIRLTVGAKGLLEETIIIKVKKDEN